MTYLVVAGEPRGGRMTLTERAQAAARKYHESWHYRLPEQFRDVRPADPNVPPQPSLAGGADPFAASIWNGEHGTALRRAR